MITTPIGELAFIDQIMAVLAEGPATTEQVAEKVGTVICACPLCDGAPRPARHGETHQFLVRLLRADAVRGQLVKESGRPCPTCGNHDSLTMLWERVR